MTAFRGKVAPSNDSKAEGKNATLPGRHLLLGHPVSGGGGFAVSNNLVPECVYKNLKVFAFLFVYLLLSSSGEEFLLHLDAIYELQQTGTMTAADRRAEGPEAGPSLARVQAAMDGILEQLPPLLDLADSSPGLGPGQQGEPYTFPYHAPSLMSLLSAAADEMPQSVGYVLLQECHWLNALLCHVRQSLHELAAGLLGGERAMPARLAACVRALHADLVPTAWVHPYRQPLGHTLYSWVTGEYIIP